MSNRSRPATDPAAPARRVGIALAVGCAALLAGCVASAPRAGEALPGVSLIGHGAELTLGWRADAPVARMLRPGSVLEVVAEYPTAAGRVTGEPLAAARVPAGGYAARFTLPDQLRNAPLGPVCLRLRVAGRSALPLRAPEPGVTSDGFGYREWEVRVAAASRRSALQTELSALDQALQRDAEVSAAFDAWRRERGLAGPAACEALMPRSLNGEQPRSVLPDPDEHPRAAERECVWRYKQLLETRAQSFAQQFESHFAGALRAERAKGTAASDGLKALYERRVNESRALRSALLEHDGATGARFQPLLLADALKITSSAEEEFMRNKRVTPAVAAAMLDAYGSCVRDSTGQFALSLRTWQREQDPRLVKARVEALRGECRSRFADETARADRHAVRQARRGQASAELAALPAGGGTAVLPTGASLVERPCRPADGA